MTLQNCGGVSSVIASNASASPAIVVVYSLRELFGFEASGTLLSNFKFILKAYPFNVLLSRL